MYTHTRTRTRTHIHTPGTRTWAGGWLAVTENPPGAWKLSFPRGPRSPAFPSRHFAQPAVSPAAIYGSETYSTSPPGWSPHTGMSERRQKRVPRPHLQGDVRQVEEKPTEPWRQVCLPLPRRHPSWGPGDVARVRRNTISLPFLSAFRSPPHPVIVPLVSVRSWVVYRILTMLILRVFLNFSLLLWRDKSWCFSLCHFCWLHSLIWFSSRAGNYFLRWKTGNNEMTAFLQSLNNLQRFEAEFRKILEA